MPGDATAGRIEQLKQLHAQWTAEFQQIRVDDPDRAAHLWDALDDLERLIVDLAIEQGTQRSDCGSL